MINLGELALFLCGSFLFFIAAISVWIIFLGLVGFCQRVGRIFWGFFR